MCTISWILSPGGYQVFFNRDEQRRRPLALRPEIINHSSGIKSLMPIDPKGNGSWVAVNNVGITVALLNFYQGRLPKGRLYSRGQIVKKAAACRSADEVEALIGGLPMHKYAPFSLLAFERHKPQGPKLIRWDGRSKTVGLGESPLISSGFDFEGVVAKRLEQYKRVAEKGLTTSSLHSFHSSHLPEKGAYSVCMHREDAETVSYTQVSVADTIDMTYCPGAPCKVSSHDYLSYSLDYFQSA